MAPESPSRMVVKKEDHSRAATPGDDDAATVDLNEEGQNGAGSRPTYRSWKKKWRKLRVIFDEKMREAETLFEQERKAKEIIKRIAIENDQYLDLLIKINDCPQIPADKRIALPETADDFLARPSDEDEDVDPKPDVPRRRGTSSTKSLETLEQDVSHLSYTKYREARPHMVADIEAADDEDEPAPFLTADELEDYLYEIDKRRGLPKMNTLAPAARKDAFRDANGATGHHASSMSLSRDFMIKHPHSAYNWLKANAPHVFLQDDDDEPTAKKSRGGAHHGSKNEKQSTKDKQEAKSTSRSSKRPSNAGRSSAAHLYKDDNYSMDEDVDYPTPMNKKRKRQAEEDGGYRPKGGSSRSRKKKKQSDVGGGNADTPSGGGRKRRASAAAVDKE